MRGFAARVRFARFDRAGELAVSELLRYAPFDRPLLAPFYYGNKSLTERRGFVLKRGELVSEASPLPGHSLDTLEQVESALKRTSSAQLFETAAGGRGALPRSLRFALEGLVAQKNPGSNPVRSNALLRWKPLSDMVTQLGQLERAGYRTVKIKLPPRGWEKLLDLIEACPQFRYRLDSNLTFTASKLDELTASLEKRSLLARVEYLEEPFEGVWDLGAFRDSPIALAADESAPGAEAALRLFDKVNPPSVFIVKPTVAGGLFSLDPFLATLKAARKKAVFTSTLEGEAGRRSIIAYLSRQPSEESGLSTGHLFLANFLGDQAEWRNVPGPSAAEKSYLDALPWRECP
jgi:O-succinylbenzoate synthase